MNAFFAAALLAFSATSFAGVDICTISVTQDYSGYKKFKEELSRRPEIKMVHDVSLSEGDFSLTSQYDLDLKKETIEISRINYVLEDNLGMSDRPEGFSELLDRLMVDMAKKSGAKKVVDRLKDLCEAKKEKQDFIVYRPWHKSGNDIYPILAALEAEISAGTEQAVTEKRAGEYCQFLGYKFLVKVESTLATNSTMFAYEVDGRVISLVRFDLNSQDAGFKNKIIKVLECSNKLKSLINL